MSRWTRKDVTKAAAMLAAALMIPAVLLLAGCRQHTTGTTSPTATVSTVPVPDCLPYATRTDGSYAACFARAQAARKQNQQAELDAVGKQPAASDSDSNASSNSGNSNAGVANFGDAIPLLIFTVVLGIAAGWLFSNSNGLALKRLPPHRDRSGPAACALIAEATATRAVGWPVAVAVLVPFGFIFNEGFSAVAILATVLTTWWAVTRWRWLHIAKAGFDLTDARWLQAAASAEVNVQIVKPDAPAGAAQHLAGEVVRQPIPPEPHVSFQDAHALGLTRGFSVPPGSAATSMLGVAGRDTPSVEAYEEVGRALGMGTTDDQGRFTFWAQIESSSVDAETGDVTLAWVLHDVTKTAQSMRPLIAPLLRRLHVRELVGGAFSTRHSDGRVVGVFTNTVTSAAPPAAAKQQQQNDDAKWTWR
jgi:hypothetical protein